MVYFRDIRRCRTMSGDVGRHRRDIFDCATRNNFIRIVCRSINGPSGDEASCMSEKHGAESDR